MTSPPNRSLHSAVPVPALSLLFVLAVAAGSAHSAGIVTHLSGTLAVKKPDGSTRLLSVKSTVASGDTLTTLESTYARVKFDDGSEVVLRPNSQLAVTDFRFNEAEPRSDNAALALVKGGMRAVTGLLGKRNPDKVGVTTSTATIGIRGTHFGLLMCQGDCLDIPTIAGKAPEDGLHIDVADGAISVTNPAGQQVIGAGQFGFVASRDAPPVIVPPGQGIQVTMPESISRNDAAGQSVGKSRAAPECTVK